jgi:multiple sugar transport system substrate-binding protein
MKAWKYLTTASAAALLGAGMAVAFAGAAAAADKVVTMWHTEPNPKSVAVLADIVARYEAAHPGIKINLEPIPWGDLDTKLQAALAAGAPPDASHGQAYVERSLSAKGLLLPIDEVVESIGEDDIYDVVKKLNYHDGHYYGLAHAIGTDLIVYRKDILRKAGISDVNESPKTWDEWLGQLKKISATGTPGLSLAGPGFFMNEEVYMWTGSNGGRLFDEKGRPTFTEPQVIEMLNFWKELDDCCLPKGWLSHSYADTFANLATGKAAEILGWGRGAYEFEKYAPDVVKAGDFGVYPSKPVGPHGANFLTQLDCEPWMIFKDGKHPQEAIEFLKFFYQKDNYTKYIHSVPTHFFPIRKSVRQSAEYKNHPDLKNWDFWVNAQENVIANYDPRPLMMTEWDDLNLPFIQEVATSGILIDMVTDVLRRDKSPEEATQRAQERAEQLITDLGYKKW